MDITFFIRSNQAGVSIGKLFRPLIGEIGKTLNVRTYYMPSAKYGIKGIIQNLWFTFCHRNSTGINHITGDCYFIIYALLGCKTVLTVHDLGFYTEHLHDMNRIKRLFLYYLQIYFPIKMATKVVAISEKTKQEILRSVPYSREIEILKHVSIDAFPYTPKILDLQHVRVLQCGTDPNKNLETTIKSLIGTLCELRVVRKMTIAQEEQAQAGNVRYSNVYDLTDEEMTKEYQDADIVVMPSLYEGFGAMVIEAQATGRPVITTDIEPMRSVSGGAACFITNPLDSKEMRKAVDAIVNDADYRMKLIEAGRKNASKYSLANCAREHILLYKSIK